MARAVYLARWTGDRHDRSDCILNRSFSIKCTIFLIVDGHAGHLSTRTKYAAPGPAAILCNRHPLQRVRPSASPLRRQREAVGGVWQARSPRPASTHQGLGKASGGSGRRESATLARLRNVSVRQPCFCAVSRRLSAESGKPEVSVQRPRIRG